MLLAVILLMLFVIICYQTGMDLSYGCKMETTITERVLLGFVCFLGYFQIVYTIFYLTNGLRTLFTFVVLAPCVLLLINFAMKCGDNIKGIKQVVKQVTPNGLTVLIIVMVALQMCCITFLQHEDDDDASYVVNSTTFINTERLQEVYPLTGAATADTFFETDQNANFNRQSWDVFAGVIGFISDCSPTVISHTALPALLLIFHYLSMYYVGGIFKEREKRKGFILMMAFLNLFGVYAYGQPSSGAPSAFLFFRIWQGKAVLVTIILPILYGFFLRVFKEEHERFSAKELFVFATICYAGRSLSSVGIYFIPFALGMLTLCYSFSRKSIIPIIQSAVCILLNLIAAVEVKKDIVADGGVSGSVPAYLTLLKQHFGNGAIVLLYAISVLLILYKGSKEAKVLFAFYPLLNFMTFLNPLFYRWIAENVVGGPVYWRILWLIPLQAAIAYAVVGVLPHLGTYIRIVGTLFVVIITVCFQGFAFSREYFTLIQNVYKLPQEVIDIGETLVQLDETPVTLAPLTINPKLRQFSADIVVVNPRNARTMYSDIQKVVAYLYSGESIKENEMLCTLRKYGIEYLVVNQAERPSELETFSNIMKVTVRDGYIIYEIDNN